MKGPQQPLKCVSTLLLNFTGGALKEYVMCKYLPSKEPPTETVMFRYFAFKEAPKSNCNLKVICLQRGPQQSLKYVSTLLLNFIEGDPKRICNV